MSEIEIEMEPTTSKAIPPSKKKVKVNIRTSYEPMGFVYYRNGLTVLLGALFSYTVNFIIHNLDILATEDTSTRSYIRALVFIFVGFVIGLVQVGTVLLSWSDWDSCKRIFFVLWILQMASWVFMFVELAVNQEEFHMMYYGFYISVSILVLILQFSYFERKAVCDKRPFEFSYFWKRE